MNSTHSSNALPSDAYDAYGNRRNKHHTSHTNTMPTHLAGQAPASQNPTTPSNGAGYSDQTADYGSMDEELSFGILPTQVMEPPMSHVFSPAIASPPRLVADGAMNDVFGTQYATDEQYSYLFDEAYKILTEADTIQNYIQAVGEFGTDYQHYPLDTNMKNFGTSVSRASSSPSHSPSSPSSTTSSNEAYSSDSSVDDSTGKRDLVHGAKASRGNKPVNEAKYRAKIKTGFTTLMDTMQLYQIEIKNDSKKYEPQSKPDLQIEAAEAIRFLMAELKQAREALQAQS